MLSWTRILHRWLPALLIMLVIFWFSAQPASDLLDFHWVDGIIKKGGHMIGYGVLALSYWRAFDFKKDRLWIAWILAVLYAVTDEFHQSFVPGRHASIWDVLIFDNLGALSALWLADRYRKIKRPESVGPVVEEP